jgi:hypothetical protein
MHKILCFDKLLSVYKDTYIRTDKYSNFTVQTGIKNQVGVKTLIAKHYKSIEKNHKEYNFAIPIGESDYTTLLSIDEPNQFKNADNHVASIEHNNTVNGLNKAAILSRCGYRCISLDEVFVGDKDLTIISPGEKNEQTPLGFIDFVCLNDKNEFVIGDVKTCNDYYKLTMEELLLKQNSARQLHIYGKMLEFMAKKNRLDIVISHYVILGVWNAKNAPNGFKNKVALWKIKNNPSKWINAISKDVLYFHPMQFQEKETVSSPKEEYEQVAMLSKSLCSGDLILVIDTQGKDYLIVNSKTSETLIRFADKETAHEWIMTSDEKKIRSLFEKKK